MDGNDLLDTLTYIDDKHILRAEKKHLNKRRIFAGALSAVAAAAAITLFVAVAGHRADRSGFVSGGDDSDSINNSDINSGNGAGDSIEPITPDSRLPIISDFPVEPEEPFTAAPNLPKLTPQIDTGLPVGGGESIGSDLSDLPSSPWNADMDFKTLPVYHSSTTDPDYDIMMQKLRSAVEALGCDISEMSISDTYVTKEDEQRTIEQWKGYGAPDEEIEHMIRTNKMMSQICASNDNYTVYVHSDYSVDIWVNNDENVIESSEESDEIPNHLLETYGDLFGLENPVRNPKPFNFGAIELYEDGTDLERFLNYNLSKIYITKNVIYIYTDSGLDKLGDYAIISVNKAVEELRNGNYLTRYTDYEITGNEPIGKIELTYLTGIGYEYVMPYYCIYVGMTDGESIDENELAYNVYYIPAVRSEYLEDITPGFGVMPGA